MQDYKVNLEIFEGPMDLLLHLVKIQEMDIQEIRIAEITSQYLSYLRLLETLDLEVAGDFLVMAATLLNIKLRALLPESVEETEEDEEEVVDIMTAKMLMEKLIEYRKFKEAAADLRDREQRQASVFFREVALPKLARADGDDELSGDLDALLVAFSRVLRFVDAKGWHLVTEDEHSVEEKMDLIERRLAAEGRLAVEEIFRECRSKLELIVCLLAMLELAHLRAVRIEQQEAHGAIYLFAVEPATAVAGDDRPPAKIVEMTPAEPAETELP